MTTFPGMASMAGMMGNTKELRIRSDQIFAGGESAGGGLCAALCMLARQTDYSNLPPAYTFVCTAEPFYCETLSFVETLRKAGVEARCDVYQGLYHAFDILSPEKEVSKDAISSPEGR